MDEDRKKYKIFAEDKKFYLGRIAVSDGRFSSVDLERDFPGRKIFCFPDS